MAVNPIWYLLKLGLFGPIPPQELERLAHGAVLLELPSRQGLLLEDPQRVYLVAKGGVKLFRHGFLGFPPDSTHLTNRP